MRYQTVGTTLSFLAKTKNGDANVFATYRPAKVDDKFEVEIYLEKSGSINNKVTPIFRRSFGCQEITSNYTEIKKNINLLMANLTRTAEFSDAVLDFNRTISQE